jgi:uncharacterized cofD-like protein
VLGDMFEHRFTDELDGHALGNLMIAALAQRIGFRPAIDELRRLLSVSARVLPATNELVTLVAVTGDGIVHGQVAVQQSTGIKRVGLDPSEPEADPDAVAAIDTADQIVIGPGSLYTSVLAALAVPGIRDAVARSRAPVVYVCNLRPQIPETGGFAPSAYVDALHDHGVEPDVVIADPGLARADGRAHDPGRLAEALLGATSPPG